VLSWGSNVNAELGNNDTAIKYRTTPDSVVYMAAGIIKPLPGIQDIRGANFGIGDSGILIEGRFIALDSTGSVWTWGKNNLGQTGLPSTILASRAKKISFGGSLVARSIDAGGRHGIALLSDGTVGTFGYGYSIGQGQESVNGEYLPRAQGIGQVVRRNLDGSCPDFDNSARFLSNVVSVGAGAFISFAITADDTVFAWGNNYEGQAGSEFWTSGKYCAWKVGALAGLGLVTIKGGTHHTLGLDKSGHVWAWGSNEWGATGVGGVYGWITRVGSFAIGPTKISMAGIFTKISAGDGFSAAMDSTGNVYVWGRNDHGQLGLGHQQPVTTPTKLPGKYLDVSAGTAHILVVAK
jgi:alpha-tubulin suppressor-like RCC1 family protein